MEVPLGDDEGLRRACVANLDVVTTISKARLVERVGALGPERTAALDDALRFALDA